MTTLEVLELGLERIKRGFCKGGYAKNEHGRVCLTWEDEASAWCAMGALGPEMAASAIAALQDAMPRESHGHLVRWSDDPDRTQADVIALYERAIAIQAGKVLAGK
jgi:hypothetical protein